MKHRIVLIGFGSIATDVAAGLRKRSGAYTLAALCRRPDTHLPDDIHRLTDFVDLMSWHPDLVVEVASQDAVREYAESCLKTGIPVIVSSAGALADDAFRQTLVDAATAGKTRVMVPSGAIGSLDYLGAVRQIGDAQVIYESRKPVAAWRDELAALGHDPDSLSEPVVLYEGDAATAATKYPQNLNVAATLALAGVGMADTQVRVVADPAVSENRHTINVESPLGTMKTQLVNQPSPSNPKTSWVVAQSVLATIEKHFSRAVAG